MAKDSAENKVKVCMVVFFVFAILSSSSLVLAGNKVTLSKTLETFFHEESMYIIDEKWVEIDIPGLWGNLGINSDSSRNKDTCAWDHTRITGRIGSNKKVIVRYRVHMSARTTNTHNEFVILELNMPYCLPVNKPWQLLVYQRQENHWFYKGDVLGPDEWYELEVDFHKTTDNSLLFSVKRTELRGTGIYRGAWTFYKLTDGKIKEVLTTYRNCIVSGVLVPLDRHYQAQLWPTLFVWPDIGMTYYIKYETHGSYMDLIDVKEIGLFGVKKDVLFTWDGEKKVFLFNEKSSECSPKDIDAMLYYDRKSFYERFNKEISELRSNGDKYQKKWGELFEGSITESKKK